MIAEDYLLEWFARDLDLSPLREAMFAYTRYHNPLLQTASTLFYKPLIDIFHEIDNSYFLNQSIDRQIPIISR